MLCLHVQYDKYMPVLVRNCLVGMGYILVDTTLKCDTYISDIPLAFGLRDIAYVPHLRVV